MESSADTNALMLHVYTENKTTTRQDPRVNKAIKISLQWGHIINTDAF
jgi:hypothetical protein